MMTATAVTRHRHTAHDRPAIAYTNGFDRLDESLGGAGIVFERWFILHTTEVLGWNVIYKNFLERSETL